MVQQWLKKSIELDEQLSYSYGPPFIQKPTYELYAEWLLENNRPEEATHQYEYSLNRGTKRASSLKGIKKAAMLSGNETLVKEIELLLEKI